MLVRLRVDQLESLYMEHAPRVRWIMHARGVPEAMVDDLVHESFIAIHRRWPKRDPSLPVATWISGVARNVAFSHRRAEARRQGSLREMAPATPTPKLDDLLAEREAWRALQRFTRDLSPKLREVFVLADVGGTPMMEIAATTGVPVATLHSRLRLARRRFSEHFGSLNTESRRAMLRSASAQQAPSKSARKRPLAALVAAVARPVVPPGAVQVADLGASKVAIAGWCLTAGVAVVGTVVAVRGSDPPRTAQVRVAAPNPPGKVETTTPSPTRIPPRASEDIPNAAVSHVDAPVTKPARTSPAPKPAEPTREDVAPDPLAVHVAALKRARALSASGAHGQALATLDGVAGPAPALARDHHRVELRAACGANLIIRAQRTALALAQRGFSINLDDPCSNLPPLRGEK